jgi:hypothetical protein
MEPQVQPEKAQKSLSDRFTISPTTAVGIIGAILLGCLAINGLMRPLSANAIMTAQNDPVLAQMEDVRATLVNNLSDAQELHQKAEELEMKTRENESESELVLCENDRMMAQYKLSMGYDHERTQELQDKVNTMCIVLGF